jgi:hypothetical protein
MDFTNRGTQSHVPSADSGATTTAGNHVKTKEEKNKKSMMTGPTWLAAIGILCMAVLLAAVLAALVFGGTDQSKYINKNDYQAVDISVGGSSTGDQIYFGNLRTINSNYLILNNVFYIPTTSTTSTNITLEPLVCQIDMPVNQMIINRSSVNWWENLQNSGKVSTTIANYEKSATTPACASTNSTTSTTNTSTPTSTSTTK